MGTPVTNFGKVTVTPPGYTSSDTSVVLSTGHGSRLPSTFPFPLTWWNSTDFSDPADDPNKEIVTVTNRSGDTLTVTRAAEGTSATNKNTGSKTYKMILGITKAMWDGLDDRSLSQTFRNLVVRTHPSSDLAASRVVFSADAIVMDDGQEVSGWNNVEIDITASGDNGLDTGSEGASRWYEIWATYDGTNKRGRLHRAKDYFLDEDFSTTDDGAHALRDNAARTKLNQGFKIDVAGPVPFVDVKVFKTGTPTGNFWFTIESNSGGVPSGTALATSRKYDVSMLGASTGFWLRIMFDTPATLSAATQYHLVLQGDFTVSASNYMSWRADTSAATYANGSKAAFDGVTWTNDTDDDFVFKIYVTENDTALTIPSNYTKALLGYVYNNGGSNFRPFVAKNRYVQNLIDHLTGSSASNYIGSFATAGVAFDLSAFVPPVPCFAEMGVDSTVGSPGLIVASLSSPSPNTYDNPVGVVISSYSSAGAQSGNMPVLNYPGLFLDSPGIIACQSGGTGHLWLRGFEW